MINQEIAQIFYKIADYLEMEELAFRPQAYRKAGSNLELLERDIADIYEQGKLSELEKIPGIGKNIARKIEEYLKTGKIKTYENLKKKTPVNLEELLKVEGMGPKKVKVLYKELGIKNLKDLEKAVKSHKIASLFGFGEKTGKNILQGIQFLKRDKGRFLLGDILPEVKIILDKLKALKEVEKISLAGSLRRRKEAIGDADILVVSKKPEKVMDFFTSLPKVEKIWAKGKTKSSVRMKQGFDVDVRIVPQESFGAALQYFTGSKDHNIALRKIAIKKGLKFSEYGLFRKSKMIAGKKEEDIYNALGLKWIPPEIREGRGELSKRLPRLIEEQDIKGDLHCHSNWNGGKNSILEMAKASMERGYQYLGITDHTKFLKIEKGLDEKQLKQQRKEIDRLNKRLRGFKILQGAETNILNDGSLDISDEALKKLDYVIAGIHSSFKMDMTERLIRAMKNPYINIISHPTGRLIHRRDEYKLDFDKILKTARQTNTILEINSYPERLDLNDRNIKKAKEMGVKMAINTDAHYKSQLRYIDFGVGQARRGWAEKKDIINAFPVKRLTKFFKRGY